MEFYNVLICSEKFEKELYRLVGGIELVEKREELKEKE
jgi:hypothetical protein